MVEFAPQDLGVLADPSAGESRAGAAHMAPGTDGELKVAPRLVGSASGQGAVLAGQLDHSDRARPGPGSLQLLQLIDCWLPTPSLACVRCWGLGQLGPQAEVGFGDGQSMRSYGRSVSLSSAFSVV
jgi:hypothetical protein